MSELTIIGREPNMDDARSARHPDQPQKPRVAFPFKLALLAAFCVLLMAVLH